VPALAQGSFVEPMAELGDERTLIRKRIKRLPDTASEETLVAAKAFLRSRPAQGLPAATRNVEGVTSRGPCSVCVGRRPPHPEVQPWRLSEGSTSGKGTVCVPCRWGKGGPAAQTSIIACICTRRCMDSTSQNFAMPYTIASSTGFGSCLAVLRPRNSRTP
jgi:hypothetical protein